MLWMSSRGSRLGWHNYISAIREYEDGESDQRQF